MKDFLILCLRYFEEFSSPKLPGLIIISLLALVSSCNKQSEGVSITYSEDVDGIFCNPERGWHWTFNPTYETNEQYPVYDPEMLEKLRVEKNITLADKYYILMDYKNTDIPQEYLDDLQRDMDILREVGLKSIVRWAYNYAGDKDMSDTPVKLILRHIEQLKPYLEKNKDVIAFMEAGFIGKWGEWHGSEENLGGEWHIDVNENTRMIYNAIMDALPEDRMVALRYIHQIQELTGQPRCKDDPGMQFDFPEEEAFSGSDLARTGRHDDWVWGDAGSNMGTWSTDSNIRECQKTYLEELSQYVPITTGETQDFNDFARYNSPIEPFFERFHFASLSLNPGYSAEAVIRFWRDNGTFDVMARRFGYRFVLHEVRIPSSIKQGGNLDLEFYIENKGFGGVYNPRLCELILRNTINGLAHHIDLTGLPENQFDPRFWFREKGIMKKMASVSLEGIPEGNYELLLNLPDPEETLYRKPEFSIRLANLNTWEPETGFNNLGITLNIK